MNRVNDWTCSNGLGRRTLETTRTVRCASNDHEEPTMTLTATTAPAYADVVDLERYPIHELDSERGRALVDSCRAALAKDGVCTLEGFITPEAVSSMVELAGQLQDKAWASDRTHTIYFEPVDESVHAQHPRAHQVRSAKHGIAYDHIPGDAPMRRLYESDDLTAFIAAALEKPVLYRSADPLDALQVTTFHPGEELGWHFDRSEFSMTVMYQQADEGGDFEYAPGLRSDDDENYEGVQEVLQGDRSRLKVLPSAPGTLAFFRGEHALHQVTPIKGATPRINSVLTYGERPDMRLNDLTSELFYGRTSS
jgi:alkylated DNA repair dioxygenase AlkB